MDRPRVLVADDQPDVLESLRLLLRGSGFAVVLASSPQSAVEAVEREDLDVVLLDLNYARDTTSGREGLRLLEHLRNLDPTLPIVVMTAWGTIEGAVAAVQLGAGDYVQKPWDNTRLVATLHSQVDLGRALRQSRRLEGETARLRKAGLPELVSESPEMKRAIRLIERVAPSDAPVLVSGEHGTGKEVFARSIHALSSRAANAFVPVNAGALSEGVFESEFFGHVRGAFTDAKQDRIGCFEMADGGTLFLDEIGEMPRAQQTKLLRVLQSGEYQAVGSSKTRRANVRVVSATNADLTRSVAEGRFREDLLYRLNAVEIHVPALRERREDIPVLAGHFLKTSSSKYGRTAADFHPDALRALLAHSWPGNVRELEHVVERAVLLAAGELIHVGDLMLKPNGATDVPTELSPLQEVERRIIENAMRRHDGNVTEAARTLGLSRSALYRRIKRHGI